MSREYEEWIAAEVAEWPGASVTFEQGGKHPRAIIAFGDQSRFTPYPSTPGDVRGVYNSVSRVRQLLADLGAARAERAKSDRPRSERNPAAKLRALPGGEPAPVIGDPWEALRELAEQPIITKPGAYADIAAELYHRAPNLLPAPSLSSSGAKTMLERSPYHFWFDSPLNPERPPESDKPHFSVGRAAHDMILLSDRWPQHYHVLPEGYVASHVNKWAEAIAEEQAARDAGKTVLRYSEAETVRRVADAIQRNPLAVATLTNGVAEETLCWQDERTGVWLRARPDFRPNSIVEGRAVMVVPDLKFVASSNASPEGFKRAIANFGYHQSAAFYCDGIKAVYGRYPTHWLHVVVEKEPPHCVALYELPGEDIERGRLLNRRAIDLFARCLDSGTWPGFADQPIPVGLPVWARTRADDIDPNEFAFSAAA